MWPLRYRKRKRRPKLQSRRKPHQLSPLQCLLPAASSCRRQGLAPSTRLPQPPPERPSVAVPSSSGLARNRLAHLVPALPPRLRAPAVRCTPPAPFLVVQAPPAAHPAVPASLRVALVLPLARAPASEHVPAEPLASCRAPARHLPVCVPLHVPANAAADSATKRPKKAQ